MGPCDIKTSAKAWNDGLDAFKKAFKQTGGKTTEAIKFAVDEINKNNPNFQFDVNSFTDPLINTLKEKGVVAKNYKFNGEKKATPASNKIDKIAEKMKGLNPDQKKAFAKKAFETFEKQGMLTDEKVKNIYAEAIGIPHMDDRLGEQIGKTSKALQAHKAVEDEIQAEIKNMQADKTANNGKLTPTQDHGYTNRFKDLADKRIAAQKEMMNEKAAFSEMLMEKRFWLHQLGDYLPLNLMNPKSLSKNVSGAVADAVIRSLSNAISSPVSAITSLFTGINSNPIGARIRGAMQGKYKSKAAMAWKHGVADFTSELPQANHLNSMNRFRKAMDEHGMAKFKGILSGILKIHPDLISKSLTVPDAMFYEKTMSEELNRIAEAKGLKGAEQKAFMLDPDEKSLEIASNIAKKFTFKQDVPTWITKLSNYDAHEAAKKMIAEGKMSPLAAKIITGTRLILQKSAFPFVKTPINIVRTASRILLPEYELAHNLIAAKNETDAVERQRLVIDGLTKAAVGFYIRHVAIQMVTQGLISAGYSDEDKKTKDIVEQELGGPNRINWSAFIRGLTFQDMKKREGDKTIDLSSGGAIGIALNVYSHAFSKYGKEEIKNRTAYNKDLTNAIKTPVTLAWAQLSSSLDQTFLTGLNQVFSAFENEHGFESDKLMVQYVSNLFTGIVPSTVQQLSTQTDPNVKRQFDPQASFGENLSYRLGYNFSGQSDKLKNKYFSLAEAGKGGLKKKRYMLFDSYMGRVLEAEVDFPKLSKSAGDTPIHRLYDASREVEKDERDKLFPASINQEVSIQYKRGGKTKSESVKLTTQQYDYLQEKASNYRMMLATPFIMSEDFKKADHQIRTKVLQEYYQEGLAYAKKDLRKAFPDIRSQKVADGVDNNAIKKLTKKHSIKPNH